MNARHNTHRAPIRPQWRIRDALAHLFTRKALR